ncbi:hypothetical protein SRHO_G00124360 [Serrasalmus rhombeus]
MAAQFNIQSERAFITAAASTVASHLHMLPPEGVNLFVMTSHHRGIGLHHLGGLAILLIVTPFMTTVLPNFEDHATLFLAIMIHIASVQVTGRTSFFPGIAMTALERGFRSAGLKLKPDPSNTEKVASWPVPHSATEVRAFLGLCSYYRRFIKYFSHIAEPRLTHKGVPFEWSLAADEAFKALKHALTSPPILAFPNLSAPFLLYTDASLHAIGCVLSQKVVGKEHVIAYASTVFTPFFLAYGREAHVPVDTLLKLLILSPQGQLRLQLHMPLLCVCGLGKPTNQLRLSGTEPKSDSESTMIAISTIAPMHLVT